MTTIFFHLLLILAVPVAVAQQFQAPVTDTNWQVIETPMECTLTQSITGYGDAKFSQKSGDDFMLVFTTKILPSTQSDLAFEIAEAPWQNIEQRMLLTTMHVEKNQNSFIIKGELAKQALTHIQEGRFPTIRYTSQNTAEEISVLMSTIHLADSMPAFQQCLDDLYPYTYNDIRKLTIHFELEKSDLNTAAQQALNKLADYVKIDDSIKRVSITGHTDSHGRRHINEPLSQARAITVKNYLVNTCGLPEKLITTSSHIERKPAASNQTATGRAINRRAEIEVFR